MKPTSRWQYAGSHGLHWVARAALRIQAPLRAQRVVQRAATWFPRLGTVEDARAVASALGTSGTCLSRALTIAARVERAQVVIGFAPWHAARPSAHAWVEVDGTKIDCAPDGSAHFVELGRLGPLAPARFGR